MYNVADSTTLSMMYTLSALSVRVCDCVHACILQLTGHPVYGRVSYRSLSLLYVIKKGHV